MCGILNSGLVNLAQQRSAYALPLTAISNNETINCTVKRVFQTLVLLWKRSDFTATRKWNVEGAMKVFYLRERSSLLLLQIIKKALKFSP